MNLNLTAPSFSDFAGLKRTCKKFKKVGRVYRCAKFVKRGAPGFKVNPSACEPGLISRSPGLIRKSLRPCVGRKSAPKARKSARRAKR